MTDTTVYEWPRDWYTRQFAQAKFYLRSSSQVSTSQWSGRRNVYGPHAQLWYAELTLTPQDAPIRNPMEAFFAQLGGMSGKMRFADPARLTPQYNLETAGTVEPWSDGTFFDDGSGWDGTPIAPTIVAAAPAAFGDTSLVVGGLPVSTSRVLRRNDVIEIRPNGVPSDIAHYYVIIKDAPSDADGLSRLEFRPPLRMGVATGDMVVLDYAQTVFYLADDDQGAFDRMPPLFGSASFKLIECVG